MNVSHILLLRWKAVIVAQITDRLLVNPYDTGSNRDRSLAIFYIKNDKIKLKRGWKWQVLKITLEMMQLWIIFKAFVK